MKLSKPEPARKERQAMVDRVTEKVVKTRTR